MPDFPSGSVRNPPPLQSILRLQRTVGNRAAQRILAIGDGYRADPDPNPPATEPEPEELRTPRRSGIARIAWMAAAGLLLLALAVAVAVWIRSKCC